MTYRRQPIIPNQIYHVFNRSIAHQPIFSDIRDYQRLLSTIDFYRFASPNLRFSFYNRLPIEERRKFIEDLRKKGQKLISIYAFCLMPNHFHILLKELKEGGIQKFTGTIQNSYAKYFNVKRKRAGSLFQEMFKANRVETDEQFLHVARYIHLNPYSSFIIKNISELEKYMWSSLPVYLDKTDLGFLDTQFLKGFYHSKEKIKSFTFDQADYQRRLDEIRHLTFE